MKLSQKLASFLAVAALASSAHALVIGFENYAPANILTNVSPTTPYSESGYTFTPTNASSAVFDSAYTPAIMFGNNSDWFGFGEGNSILEINNAAQPFDLISLNLALSSLASGPFINFTITGNLHGGGTVVSTFNNVTSMILVNLNWSNLDSVSFNASDDAGIDNITVQPTSVPDSGASALLVLMGTAGAFVARRSLRFRPVA